MIEVLNKDFDNDVNNVLNIFRSSFDAKNSSTILNYKYVIINRVGKEIVSACGVSIQELDAGNKVLIGCVCTKEDQRKKGYGSELVSYVKERYDAGKIILTTKEVNLKFYQDLGFNIKRTFKENPSSPNSYLMSNE